MKKISLFCAFLCTMLFSVAASATEKTYDFVQAAEGETLAPTYGADAADGQLLATSTETFDNRFAVGPTSRNNGTNNGFIFRTAGNFKGLWSQYADRTFTILNLKQGDKYSIKINSGTLNFTGGSAVVSEQEYTASADGNVAFTSTAGVYIESVTINTVESESTSYEYDTPVAYDFVQAAEGETLAPTYGADAADGQLLATSTETFDNRFAVGPTSRNNGTNNGFIFRTAGNFKGLWSQYADRTFTILNLKQGDKYSIKINSGTLNFTGGSAVVSEQEYTASADGNVAFTSTAGVYIESVTITSVKEDDDNTPTTPTTPTTTEGDYTITINEADNGTVTADHTNANENETVTLTVTPASDSYKLVDLRIEQWTDDEGDTPIFSAPRRAPGFIGTVTATKVDANHYTFTMPANNVVITATFTDNPVARPTITYDADNNKVTVKLTTDPTGEEADYAANVKIYYTTDGTDPAASETKQESTTDVDITVTKDITIVRAVGVSSDNHTSVEVSQEVSLVRYLTVSKEWTVFCSPETFAVPDGLKAYTISSVTQPTESGEEGVVTLKEQNIIAEGVPMVIENTDLANTTKFKIENTTGTVAADDQCSEFKGSATAASTLNSANANYVLKNGAFIRTTATQVSQYNCYLEFSASSPAAGAPRYSMTIGGNTTGIKTLGTAQLNDDQWYSLSGVRIDKPTHKGIYIHNGKKIIIK